MSESGIKSMSFTVVRNGLCDNFRWPANLKKFARTTKKHRVNTRGTAGLTNLGDQLESDDLMALIA